MGSVVVVVVEPVFERLAGQMVAFPQTRNPVAAEDAADGRYNECYEQGCIRPGV